MTLRTEWFRMIGKRGYFSQHTERYQGSRLGTQGCRWEILHAIPKRMCSLPRTMSRDQLRSVLQSSLRQQLLLFRCQRAAVHDSPWVKRIDHDAEACR